MCIGVTRLISSKGINQWNYTISYKFTTKYDTKWNICLKQESGLIKVKRNVKLYCSPKSLKPCSDIDWLGIVKSLRLHQDLSKSTIYFVTEGRKSNRSYCPLSWYYDTLTSLIKLSVHLYIYLFGYQVS